MALKLRVKQSTKNIKFMGLLVALSALLVQPFTALQIPVANAVPGVTYSNTGFSGLSWGVDRRLPSGGWSVSGDTLSMTVDGNLPPSSAQSAFEGVEAALPANTADVSAKLYVDPAWSSQSVIAGMWASTPLGSDNDNVAWPTLEFNNVDNTTASVDVFDTFGGDIRGVTSVTYGDTIELEIQANTETDKLNYYLNDTLIYSHSAEGYGPLSSVIFNNYNDGVADSAYTTNWSSLRTGTLTPAPETCNDTSFDSFANGSVNGQNGWKATNVNLDQEVVDNIYGYPTFGCKSLRISNAVTSGGFGDQTFTAPADGLAGENAVRDRYEASFSFGSTKQTPQPGLSISVSPDDGIGNRMSYVGLADDAVGEIALTFYDTDSNGGFKAASLGTVGSDEPHTVKLAIDFKDGGSNDVVKVFLDNELVHTGTTWEDYYRYSSEQAGNGNVVPSVDRLIFRAGGTAAPATKNSGFLFDGVSVATSSTDTSPTTTINAPTGLVGRTFTVSGHAKDDLALNRVYVQLVNRQDNKRYGGATINLIGQGAEADWSKTYDAKALNLPDGDYAAHVSVVDMAGNKGSAGWTANFAVDSTAPVVSDVRVKNPVSGVAEIRFKLTEHNSVNLAPGKTHVRFTHGEELQNASAQSANAAVVYDAQTGDYVASIDTTSFASDGYGKYWVYIRAQDSLSNAGGYDDTRGIVVDNLAPAQVTGVTYYDNNGQVTSGYTDDYSVTVRWNAVGDAQKYEYCYYNDIATSPYREANCYTTNPTTNQQSGALNQGEGTHFVKVRAIDAAGNAGVWSAPKAVVYDATNPDAQVRVSNTAATTDEIVTVTGEVTAESNIKSHWFEITAPGGTKSYKSNMNTSDKSFSFALNTSVGVGEYVIRYVASDRAGNRSDDPSYSNSKVVTVTITEATVEEEKEEVTQPDTGSTDGGVTDTTTNGGTANQSTSNSPSNAFATLAPLALNSGETTVGANEATVGEAQGEVLGDKTDKSTSKDDGDVLAATDDANAGCWTIMGVCWYWVIPPVVIVALGAVWYALSRRGNEDDPFSGNVPPRRQS